MNRSTQVPLRVDFAGGWLDHPCFSDKRYYVINCAIAPLVSFDNWIYKDKSGLGGSAATAVLRGLPPVETEARHGNGWQDVAVIVETGFCLWRSGELPSLILKRNPDWLLHKMALMWTGSPHKPGDLRKEKRPYDLIKEASVVGKDAAETKDIGLLQKAVDMTYQAQLKEGMEELPQALGSVRKYCGSGWGGYVVHLFEEIQARERFLRGNEEAIAIEPYIDDKLKQIPTIEKCQEN